MEDACKIVVLSYLAVHSPKPILDVPLCHEYLGIFLGFGKGMDDPAQGVAKLVEGTLWCHVKGSIIDRLNKTAVLEPKAEG